MDIPVDEQNLIQILGIEALDDDRKMRFLNQVSELLQKRLLLRILDGLDESKQKEFASILDNNDQDGMTKFLTANVPDMDAWLFEEIKKIKQEFADQAAKVE